MAVERLTIEGVRNLQAGALSPGPVINWLHGENGAGKTSVLEAIHLVGRGRSFRAARPGSVIQHGAEQLRVVVKRQDGVVLGVERSPEGWRGRIGGRDSQRISEFAAALPLVLIEPDSHRLVDGGPDRRRQYLDWQLFHVEPDYLEAWQRYARLLKQRNAALKSGARDAMLDALEAPMLPAAERLDTLRRQQVSLLEITVRRLLETIGIRLPGEVQLAYRRGFPVDETLADALRAQRDSDRERGFTQRGPHRADLALKVDGHPAAVELSRGQQKLLALALLLAQLHHLDQHGSQAPLLLLDDPVSELDRRHLESVLGWLAEQRFQTWVTATEPPDIEARLFHVEQGAVRPQQ
ncbi:DNA replication/repair protein RecF [Wenzhouxiangella marina]|uniref:DNA replication and repair protein RecF n=1 Tax=Wenzhouxiangella marina TaxID=1579979 RepID=A0A0K0XRQ1_9GAMM|nr:DNA replication/repair protein RecF [Wenzhouxiangella marina]AKS40394.1 DNA replication and repair protein RecF [Wenzhouxiangella marina]MBB6088284.1 DNA replication and repair protein RecF [Wenzhouxiangella marina]